MHDATEGGVIGGLLEVAIASNLGIRVDRERIPVRPEVRAVCDHVGIDPYTAISEGTLIATVVPGRADAFVARARRRGDRGGDRRRDPSPSTRDARSSRGPRGAAHPPGLDPFWGAFGAWAADAAAGPAPVPESLGTLRRRWI